MEYPPALRVIKAAKEVGEKFIYYSPATNRVRFRRDNNTPTMDINCSLVIAYSDIFIYKLTDEELTNVVLHEILHYMNGHHARYMNNSLKDALPFEIHNIAMDLEINEFIYDLPEGAYRAENFGFPKRKSYEEYLLLLKKNMPDMQSNNEGQGKNQQKNNSDDGDQAKNKMPINDLNIDDYSDNYKDGLDKLKDEGQGRNQQENNSDDEDQAQNKMPINDLNFDDYNDNYKDALDKLKDECKESEKNRGTESGSDDINRRIQKRKYRWEQVFQNILTTKITEITAGFRYRTFEKTNRRYIHTPDIILPVFIDRKIKISLAIIMDVSGSMYHITDKMYGVMKSMVDILDMAIDITILEVDADVVNIIRGFDLKRDTIESKSGGGTDMGAGLRYIRENKMEPDLIVVMTDSYTPWPDPPILADKTVVLTDNPDYYNGPYPMYPVIFD